MTKVIVLLVAAFALVAAQNIVGDNYVVYGAGQDFTTPPAGYKLASLTDIQSESFTAFYNINGLVDLPQTMDGCCIFNISEGFLVIGSVPNNNYSYIAPYSQSGSHQCAEQLQSPVFFGGAFDVGPYQGQFIGKLTSALVAELATVPQFSGLGCAGNVNSFGIYVKSAPKPTKPTYVIYATGQSFPTPPTGYSQMALSDVTSTMFVDYYNAHFLLDLNQTMDGCCLFNLTDGYLAIGSSTTNYSYVSPFYTSGQFMCIEQLINPVAFGGCVIVGPYADMYIGKITPSVLSQFLVVQGMDSRLGCQGTVNTFALFQHASATVNYIIYGAGPSFPTPPTGFTMTSMADLQSNSFVDFYNKNGLNDMQQQMDGCCVFAVQNGYAGIGSSISNASYLAPFTSGGQHECATQLTSPVYLGTAYGVGPYNMIFLGNFTPSIVSQLLLIPTLEAALGCGSGVNTFAIYKST